MPFGFHKKGKEEEEQERRPIATNVTDKEDLEEINKHLTLMPMSIKLIKNKFHRTIALLLDKSLLSLFNSNNIVFFCNLFQ